MYKKYIILYTYLNFSNQKQKIFLNCNKITIIVICRLNILLLNLNFPKIIGKKKGRQVGTTSYFSPRVGYYYGCVNFEINNFL